ncbi:DUF5572 domain-containing protein [Sporobolomyces koalae]|uniref:DUF5572 domain-containing protein n=1 Tax=Sporobolomyces koalae TaxID=500713 RepID=UPI00316FD6A2
MSTEPHYVPRTTIEDPLFLQGLSSILAPYYARNAPNDEIQQVTDRAESFFLASQNSSDQPTTSAGGSTSEPPPPATGATSDKPPYPLSFAHLAQLISSGQPIPGIKEIPDLVTEETPTESREAIRKKPWEDMSEHPQSG